MSDCYDWRSVDDDLPDWKDPFPGMIELKREDGSVVVGFLDYDVMSTDDFPVLMLKIAGQPDSIHDFAQWRPFRPPL